MRMNVRFAQCKSLHHQSCQQHVEPSITKPGKALLNITELAVLIAQFGHILLMLKLLIAADDIGGRSIKIVKQTDMKGGVARIYRTIELPNIVFKTGNKPKQLFRLPSIPK